MNGREFSCERENALKKAKPAPAKKGLIKIKIFAITGFFFMVLGTASLIHPRILLPQKTDISHNGGQSIIVETRRVVRVPMPVGIVWLLAGCALAYLSTQEPPPETERSRSRRRF